MTDVVATPATDAEGAGGAATGIAPLSAPTAYELLPFPERGTRRRDLANAVSEFFVDESTAMDEARYEDWLGYLAEGFIYQVPVPLLREDPKLPRHSDRALLFEATKHVLSMKLGRVGRHYAWSDRPAGVMRHFVSAVRVYETEDPTAFRVDSNVLATWTRGRDEAAIVTAARHDIVQDRGTGEFHLLRRRVLLDTEVATHEQLSIIF